jgi:hypothetical protein
VFLATLAMLACAPARAADSPPVAPLPELAGARTLGLSSSVATASGNEGIFVNPGALAASRRYSVEMRGVLERRGAVDVGQLLEGSVVDGLTSPVAAGVAWAKIFDGVHEGSIIDFALAGSVSSGITAGVTGKYLNLVGPERVQAVTVDAGILWRVGEWVSLGAAGYNLVPIANEIVAPRSVSAGVAVGSDRFLQLTAEWSANLDTAQTKNRYAAGVEVLLGQFPLRGGYVQDELTDARWWTAGAGVVQGKVGFDFGYRQSLDDPNARMASASLKLYFTE